MRSSTIEILLERYAIGDARLHNHGRMSEEPLASLVAAAPDCRPNGPLDHSCHDKPNEAQSRAYNLAPAWVVGVATLDTNGDRNARHLSHHNQFAEESQFEENSLRCEQWRAMAIMVSTHLRLLDAAFINLQHELLYKRARDRFMPRNRVCVTGLCETPTTASVHHDVVTLRIPTWTHGRIGLNFTILFFLFLRSVSTGVEIAE
ncbi:hypothetical protein KC19_4G236900 [Ceratodon purpureus]|uniref:Uncharacterized protein n=1 Tax=Ceratodon purpureus TaxID=3225 RepID=A0A8T0IE30_CERPU|nr:hypothetical protein KC19_4G236900 [Ceratodon purpureus]